MSAPRHTAVPGLTRDLFRPFTQEAPGHPRGA